MAIPRGDDLLADTRRQPLLERSGVTLLRGDWQTQRELNVFVDRAQRHREAC